MAVHYTYFDHIIPQVSEVASHSQKIILALILGITLILLGKRLTARLSKAEGLEEAIIPDEKPSLFGFFDLFIEAFIKYHDSVVGKELRKHIPFTASVFMFILFANLLGLIPGMPAITTTVWVNVGMALVVFFYFNGWGFKVNGVGYLKHFAGPFWWLVWFMFPLELFSTCLRVLTLNLRLYWNITADHVVLSTFTDLLSFPFLAAPFYVLGTFVSFVQAFIFTTLTMIYILLAVQHEEAH